MWERQSEVITLAADININYNSPSHCSKSVLCTSFPMCLSSDIHLFLSLDAFPCIESSGPSSFQLLENLNFVHSWCHLSNQPEPTNSRKHSTNTRTVLTKNAAGHGGLVFPVARAVSFQSWQRFSVDTRDASETLAQGRPPNRCLPRNPSLNENCSRDGGTEYKSQSMCTSL